MLGLPFLPRNLPKVDLEGYPRRLDAGVSALIQACGLDVEREMARFCACRDRLGVRQKQGPAADMMEQVRQTVVGSAPLIFELVTTFAESGLKGFGYLTQGRPTGTLPVNLGELLAGTLELHLAGGGSEAEAVELVDVFRLAFPNLAGLADFSSLSQGMIVGMVPHGDRLTLKIYFNTRLDPSGDHRARVAAILERCGLEDHGLYSLLYTQSEGARFHGVGIDLDGDGVHRAKLYVRMTEKELGPALERLAAKLEPDAARAQTTIVAPVHDMLEAMRSDALVDEMELAAALSTDRPSTAKVTLFWASDKVGGREQAQLQAYLDRQGYPAHALDPSIAALAENAARAVSQKHPLHGVGIEVPTAGRPKLNVYLQPVL